jgi:hypothetical protein
LLSDISISPLLSSLRLRSVILYPRSTLEETHFCHLHSSCLLFRQCPTYTGGTQFRSWLRHYDTSHKVAGSISDVIGFFNWLNPSSCIMALRPIQPLRPLIHTQFGLPFGLHS